MSNELLLALGVTAICVAFFLAIVAVVTDWVWPLFASTFTLSALAVVGLGVALVEAWVRV